MKAWFVITFAVMAVSSATFPATFIAATFIAAARADSELPASERPPVDESSANYHKSEKLLPGEEVVTPTGKKVKVWSTSGPVPVSRAPAPFDDPQKTTLDNVHVVVDHEGARSFGKDHSHSPEGHNSTGHNSKGHNLKGTKPYHGDSFDTSQGK